MAEVKILNIGDIHLGAIDLVNFEQEFNDFIFPLIIDEEPDIIVLHGDVFDTRVSLDSEASKMGFMLVSALCHVSETYGCQVRLIRGTITHDYSQLDNFLAYESQYENFRIINECQEEILEINGENVRILYIPEEYPKDYVEYYGKFFYEYNEDGEAVAFKDYDVILGHGEIDQFAGYVNLLESESFVHTTPLHEAAEFLAMLEESGGYCAFGHIHVRLAYKRVILSIGSLTRWAQGEEQPKGVYLVTMSRPDEETQWELDIQFKENNFAPLYKKYNAAEEFTQETPIDEMFNRIIELIDEHDLTKIRMDFSDFDISAEAYTVLKGKFVGDKRVDIKSKAKIKSVTQKKFDDEGNELELTEDAIYDNSFDYLNDPAVPHEDRLKQYIDEEVVTDVIITIDDIREITAPVK